MITYSSSHDTITNNATKQMEIQFAQFVVKRIKEKKVLWQIFSRERGHLQLLTRSEELLKLLLSQDQLSQADLEFIWNARNVDEAQKLELYNLLSEISPRLRYQEVSFIIDQINQIPLQKVVLKEIELVYELAKKSRTSNSDYGQQAAEFLWNITLSNIE